MPGAGIGLFQVASRGQGPSGPPPFSPADLFASGEQGGWYDPSDLSTMRQTHMGISAVVANAPVGLMLDKRAVLGSELAVNGGFDTDITGWTLTGGTQSVESGVVTLTNVTSRTLLTQSFTTEVGKSYRVVIEQASNGNSAANGARLRVTSTNSFAGTLLLEWGHTDVSKPIDGLATFVATGTTSYIWLGNNTVTAGNWVSFGGVSVVSDTGNHLTQADAARRPVLRQDAGGKYYLEFDGVDDFLLTSSINFTASDKAVMAAAYTKIDNTARSVFELSASPTTLGGTLRLTNGPDYFNQTFGIRPGGNAGHSTARPDAFGVHIGRGAIKPGLSETWWNGTKATNAAVDAHPTLTLGTFPLYLGARGGTSMFSNAPLYGVLVVAPSVAAAQIDDDTITLINDFLVSKGP